MCYELSYVTPIESMRARMFKRYISRCQLAGISYQRISLVVAHARPCIANQLTTDATEQCTSVVWNAGDLQRGGICTCTGVEELCRLTVWLC